MTNFTARKHRGYACFVNDCGMWEWYGPIGARSRRVYGTFFDASQAIDKELAEKRPKDRRAKRTQADEIKALRAAFLRHVQIDNGCVGAKGCFYESLEESWEAKHCGCALEARMAVEQQP